ncbi:hypothetical protein MIS45_01910 [Wielerella bovis]|uniref:hypothetical protein n=1 Tax=Wielerella bovis TaxID=2917790 RepID=UPI0020192CED|nr:hypothetical protein [Wielerella bovis]ULJ69636.1 hypothetical protein MIS45_01910 [Wielerella bovis]
MAHLINMLNSFMENAEFTDDDTDTDEVEAEETKIAPTHLPKQLDSHIADVAVVQDDATHKLVEESIQAAVSSTTANNNTETALPKNNTPDTIAWKLLITKLLLKFLS